MLSRSCFRHPGSGPAGCRAARFPTAGRPSGGERRQSQQNMPRRVEISRASRLGSNTPWRRTSLTAKLEFGPKIPSSRPPARLDLIERPCRVLGTHTLPARRHCLALCPHHGRVPQRPRGMKRRHASPTPESEWTSRRDRTSKLLGKNADSACIPRPPIVCDAEVQGARLGDP